MIDKNFTEGTVSRVDSLEQTVKDWGTKAERDAAYAKVLEWALARAALGEDVRKERHMNIGDRVRIVESALRHTGFVGQEGTIASVSGDVLFFVCWDNIVEAHTGNQVTELMRKEELEPANGNMFDTPPKEPT